MCNCGCETAWATSAGGDLPSKGAPTPVTGKGCITGGGNFSSKTYDCTNYWQPTDLNAKHERGLSKCASANMSTLKGCTGNMTTKITGNDNVLSEFMY
jgi:hypothetical protein|tara:strand:+ start:30 stop:323 length:294 start_codon:yes stop_codon:yes gene_type:complete